MCRNKSFFTSNEIFISNSMQRNIQMLNSRKYNWNKIKWNSVSDLKFGKNAQFLFRISHF